MAKLSAYSAFSPGSPSRFCELGAVFGGARDTLRASVKFAVEMTIQEFQVLRAIICLVAVSVVDMLRAFKCAAKRLLHDPAVFADISAHRIGMARHTEQDISKIIDVTPGTASHAVGIMAIDKSLGLSAGPALAAIRESGDGGGLSATAGAKTITQRPYLAQECCPFPAPEQVTMRWGPQVMTCDKAGHGVEEVSGFATAALTQHGYSIAGLGG